MMKPVDGGSKWRRGGSVAAVESGGGHACRSAKRDDRAPASIRPDCAGRPRGAIRHGVIIVIVIAVLLLRGV